MPIDLSQLILLHKYLPFYRLVLSRKGTEVPFHYLVLFRNYVIVRDPTGVYQLYH